MYKLETVNLSELAARVADGGPGVPLRVKIKLIWACNLKCSFCSQWRVQGLPPPKAQWLKEASLLALLDDLQALGCQRVHFSGGEPLLKPDLARWIREVRDRGMHCSMTSNGTLWTPERADELVAAGLQTVTFSIDSHLPEVHNRMRGQELWHQTVKGVRHARKAAKRAEVRLKIRTNTVVSRLNYRALADYPDFAAELGVKAMALLPVDDVRMHGQPAVRLGLEEIREWNSAIGPRLAERALALGLMRTEAAAFPFGRSEEETAFSAEGLYAKGFYRANRCYTPWLHSVIAADGSVYGCCQMKGEGRVIGSLQTHSFREIWTGEAYKDYRLDLAARRPAVCQRCDDFLPENKQLTDWLEDV
jgi:radical SAM protein with 4Fe4S-binding SPASM domain